MRDPAFTPKDWLIILAGLVIVIGLEWRKPQGLFSGVRSPAPMATQDAMPEPAPASDMVEVWHEQPALSAAQQQVFDAEMGQARFFSAFAIGDASQWGWSREFSDAPSARQAALALCGGGTGCRIVYERWRPGASGQARDTLTASQQQALDLVNVKPGPRAFARSRNGYWGWGTAGTLAAARARALTECRKVWRQARGMPEAVCEILHEWR